MGQPVRVRVSPSPLESIAGQATRRGESLARSEQSPPSLQPSDPTSTLLQKYQPALRVARGEGNQTITAPDCFRPGRLSVPFTGGRLCLACGSAAARRRFSLRLRTISEHRWLLLGTKSSAPQAAAKRDQSRKHLRAAISSLSLSFIVGVRKM